MNNEYFVVERRFYSKKRKECLKKYIYVVYIVKGSNFAKIGLYPWGILWVCLGYHLARYRVWIVKGCIKARAAMDVCPEDGGRSYKKCL